MTQKNGADGTPSVPFGVRCGTSRDRQLQLRTGGNKRLAGLVARELREFLDEKARQILGLHIPAGCVGIRVVRIQNLRIYAWKLRRNLEVKDRNLFVGALSIEPSKMASMNIQRRAIRRTT